jgi:putative hydrolase of the HAD superfamily
MLTSIDAIIFDLGGVVLNLDYNKTIDQFKILGKENFEKLYTQSQQDKIFDQFETGKISAQEFRNYMKFFLDGQITDEQIDFAWNAMLLDLPAARIDLLLRLKKEYKIFLFSNTNEIHSHAFQKIIQQQYGDANLLEKVFQQTYYSHLVGQRKPDAASFMTVINDHGLTPQRTLFIDDSIQHIEGASRIGIRAKHLVDQDIIQLFS